MDELSWFCRTNLAVGETWQADARVYRQLLGYLVYVTKRGMWTRTAVGNQQKNKAKHEQHGATSTWGPYPSPHFCSSCNANATVLVSSRSSRPICWSCPKLKDRSPRAPRGFGPGVDGPAPDVAAPQFPAVSIDLRVAITLSSPPSSKSKRSELGDSRIAVGIPLRRDKMLFERVTPFPFGEMNEFDLDSTPTFLERSAKTELELSFRLKVGGFELLGPADGCSSFGTRNNALKLDMLPPCSPRLYILFSPDLPEGPFRPDGPAGFGRFAWLELDVGARGRELGGAEGNGT